MPVCLIQVSLVCALLKLYQLQRRLKARSQSPSIPKMSTQPNQVQMNTHSMRSLKLLFQNLRSRTRSLQTLRIHSSYLKLAYSLHLTSLNNLPCSTRSSINFLVLGPKTIKFNPATILETAKGIQSLLCWISEIGPYGGNVTAARKSSSA